MNILITGIGGPTPRSIAKTIRINYPNARIIGVDIHYKALGFFMDGLLDKSYSVPRANASDYWIRIKEIITKEKIKIAFVQPEKEVIEWGLYFKKSCSYPVKVLIPPLSLSESLMDKAIMADLLKDTGYIPKTIRISQKIPNFNHVQKEIGFPCWIRATTGSGGLGSLKIENLDSLKSWLFINREIEEFTVSEFLSGRHLATQMLYYNGEYLKGASLECVEYVMASIAPSKVTGNTSYGRMLNEDKILEFCHACVEYLCKKLDVKPHGVLSFDLKEDENGQMRVTEINIRHMAYTGIMAELGFDLISDTISILNSGPEAIKKNPYYRFKKSYAFLRDVDIEPIIVDDKKLRI